MKELYLRLLLAVITIFLLVTIAGLLLFHVAAKIPEPYEMQNIPERREATNGH